MPQPIGRPQIDPSFVAHQRYQAAYDESPLERAARTKVNELLSKGFTAVKQSGWRPPHVTQQENSKALIKVALERMIGQLEQEGLLG